MKTCSSSLCFRGLQNPQKQPATVSFVQEPPPTASPHPSAQTVRKARRIHSEPGLRLPQINHSSAIAFCSADQYQSHKSRPSVPRKFSAFRKFHTKKHSISRVTKLSELQRVTCAQQAGDETLSLSFSISVDFRFRTRLTLGASRIGADKYKVQRTMAHRRHNASCAP